MCNGCSAQLKTAQPALVMTYHNNITLPAVYESGCCIGARSVLQFFCGVVPFILDVGLQLTFRSTSRGETGGFFFIFLHLPFGVFARLPSFFLLKRVQPSLSLVTCRLSSRVLALFFAK